MQSKDTQSDSKPGCFIVIFRLVDILIISTFRQFPTLVFCLVAFFYTKQYIAIVFLTLAWLIVTLLVHESLVTFISLWKKTLIQKRYISVFSKCEFTKRELNDYISQDIIEDALKDMPIMRIMKGPLSTRLERLKLYNVKRGNSVKFPSTVSAFGSPSIVSPSYLFATNLPKDNVSNSNYDSPFSMQDYFLRHELGHLAMSNSLFTIDPYLKSIRPIISLIIVSIHISWNQHAIPIFLVAILVHALAIFSLFRRRIN